MLTEELRVPLEPQLKAMARRIPVRDLWDDLEQDAWVAVLGEADRHPNVAYLASVARNRMFSAMRTYRTRGRREQAVQHVPEQTRWDTASVDLLLDELPGPWRVMLVAFLVCGGDTYRLAQHLGLSRKMAQRRVQMLRRIVIAHLTGPAEPVGA